MTDKEIIIDGVNVAGCYFCKNNFELTDIEGLQKCSEIRDCFYKQLQRKTQELEQLQEDYTELELRHNDSYKEFLKLKQECEERKEIFKEYAKSPHYNNTEFKQERDSLIQEIQYNNRYKQALEKIEEILKCYANSSMGELQPNGTYKYIFGNSLINGKKCIHYDPRKAQEGLKIINEVKDAD